MQNNLEPNLQETEAAIIERDKKDAKIDDRNRKDLVKVGLKPYKPKRIIKINTGKVIGVENVVNLIVKQLKEVDKIISIEGTSSCGKSSTAEMLAEKIKVIHISVGGLVRYLTYYIERNQVTKLEDILLNLSYKIVANKACLFEGNDNLSAKLVNDLHSHNIDLKVTGIAKISQEKIIKFLTKEIKRLRENLETKIVIDGRAHTLDFLPSDVRIILNADSNIRAKRRLKQNGKK